MPPAKEQLREAIEPLAEAEAVELMKEARRVSVMRDLPPALRSLADDPAIRLPTQPGPFPPVEPIPTEGIPASEMRITDRR